jgi:cell envelope opacity-associated protein A
MSNFTNGQEVTQVLPEAIKGVVSGFALDQENGEVIVLVNSTDVDGTVHSRYFRQEEIA